MKQYPKIKCPKCSSDEIYRRVWVEVNNIWNNISQENIEVQIHSNTSESCSDYPEDILECENCEYKFHIVKQKGK